MVNYMLSYSGLNQEFWGEAMLTACCLLNRVPTKRNRITPYELWTKRKPNLNYLRVWGCRAVVRLLDPKLKTLGERGIECIFVGYAEHSKAFRFFVIEPNGSVLINSIIESRDAIFNENRFSLVPRPSLRIPNRTEDIGGLVVPEEVANLLVEWIFKRKLKVDGTIEKFKARLVIQGFKQNSRIYYFDTYALVTCISTIRLLIAMSSIHNLIIHQMDVKIAFLNGDLDEKQAPKQWHQKFDEVVLSNGYLVNQADKCVDMPKEFLSSRFSMKGMGKADVILGINIKHESNRITISQSHYIEKHNNSSRYNDNKGKSKHHDNTKADLNKKSKVTCWRCGKPGHMKKDCKGGKVGNKANGSGTNGSVDGFNNSLKEDDVAWWVDSGATIHVCKDGCWFKNYESLNDGSILHMGIESTSLVHRRAFMSTSKLNDSILWHARLGHVHFKRMQDMYKDGLILAFDMDNEKCIGIQSLLDLLKHSKAFKFYVIEPNESVSINSIIESRDAIFDKNRFSSVLRPSLGIPKGTKDIGGCRPLGCKWIFKRKLKVDGTIEKFKARLVIQDFKQKSGIYYVDTYAPVARISTIRLLIAMAPIHNLIIHQMDVKTAFLNGDLDAEVYMNQPQVFIMPGNENKVCKLIKSLYRLKQTPKQWHQKFDEVVLSNGYLLNQADKYVYSKFNESSKGVIICLYVNDMLIFGTDQVQVT
ncbi:zinc finger, CCHC-type containing protein [Tanacetum coccineum]